MFWSNCYRVQLETRAIPTERPVQNCNIFNLSRVVIQISGYDKAAVLHIFRIDMQLVAVGRLARRPQIFPHRAPCKAPKLATPNSASTMPKLPIPNSASTKGIIIFIIIIIIFHHNISYFKTKSGPNRARIVDETGPQEENRHSFGKTIAKRY